MFNKNAVFFQCATGEGWDKAKKIPVAEFPPWGIAMYQIDTSYISGDYVVVLEAVNHESNNLYRPLCISDILPEGSRFIFYVGVDNVSNIIFLKFVSACRLALAEHYKVFQQAIQQIGAKKEMP